MSQFVENSIQFAAECVRQNGQCRVIRENILFLDDGSELAAVDQLQRKCGHVVIVPDRSVKGKALLYHTSCERMNDVVGQIFANSLEEPVSLPQFNAEMSLGELHRRGIALAYEDCRAKVKQFRFEDAPAT